MKEKRPTISPNFNFLGQLLDFEKKIKSPTDGVAKPAASSSCPCEEALSGATEGLREDHVPPCIAVAANVDVGVPGAPGGVSPAEKKAEEEAEEAPLMLPCVLAGVPEEQQLLAQALCSLQLGDGVEESTRLKRSFSLDIKSYGEASSAVVGGSGGGGVGGGGGGGGVVGGSGSLRGFSVHGGSGSGGDGPEGSYYKSSGFKEPASKPCQFSPVEEVSEQSTPEQSPDKEQADGPAVVSTTITCASITVTSTTISSVSCTISSSNSTSSSGSSNKVAPKPPKPSLASSSQQPLQRSGSMEASPSANASTSASAASFLFGLSRSQQHLAKAASGHGGHGAALKGWHSDILLGPVAVSSSSLAGGWYLSHESAARFYSTSAIFSAAAYGCGGSGGVGPGLESVRRRGRQRSGDRGDSRRSWHEESNFEKQLKRRSCQMEFGDGMSESRSREELVKVGSQSSFSGSMEIIEVS